MPTSDEPRAAPSPGAYAGHQMIELERLGACPAECRAGSEGGGGSSPTATSCCSSKATKLVMMGHEDIVWEEDLTIRVVCWSWGILSLSDRSRLLSLCRLGSVGVSEADATRGVAPVIAGGTLARCLSSLLERGGLTGGLGGCECGRGRRPYVRLDDAFGLGS